MILHMTTGDPKYHDKGVGNVIKIKRVKAQEREHQTQKPIHLLESLIRVVCPVDGIILDPFFGSGSLGVAAENLNRKWIGIDINPEYVKIANERIRVETAQLNAFHALHHK